MAFVAVPGQPGMFYWDATIEETPAGSGIYTIDGGVETPPGSGIYSFDTVAGGPQLTVTNIPPSVHIVFESLELPTGTHTLNLFRTIAGVETPVREGVGAFADGGWVGDDWEVPPGVTVSYRAEAFDSSGVSLGFTVSQSCDVGFEGAGVGWISDPLDSTSAIRVVLARSAGQSPSRPMLGNLYQVGLRTVALVSRQSLVTDLNMDFFTYTEADRDAVQALLNHTGGLILIRTPPPMMVPRMLYCWAVNCSPAEYNLAGGVQKVRWANQVSEISAPVGNLFVTTVTYQTYMDAFPTATYGDVMAVYTSTYFDAMKNPPGA